MTRTSQIVLSVLGGFATWLVYLGANHPRNHHSFTLRGYKLGNAHLNENGRKRGRRSDKAPTMVLQVGPPDTSAAAMRLFATSHESELQKDNYYVVQDGIYLSCYASEQIKEKDCSKAWKQFGSELQKHREKNHNILISNEWIGLFHNKKDAQSQLWGNLMPLMEQWDVRVVYTYQRYHEWLPNHYNEITPGKATRAANWPDQGGMEVSSFPDAYDRVIDMAELQPQSLLKQWQNRFDNVSIWNTNAPGNSIKNFFCNEIPEASNFCAAFDNFDDTSVPRDDTVALQFDLLSVAAYKRGLVNASLSRPDVAISAEHYGEVLHYTRKKDYPLKCLSQEKLDSFWSLSESMEQEILPEFYESEDGKATLKHQFEKSYSKLRFPCSFDVDALLGDTRWETFFQNLGNRPLPWEADSASSGSNQKGYPIDYADLDVDISFLGIGAQGAGTTWLADMFRVACPRLDFGKKKEIHFWDWHRFEGLKWYSEQFPNRHKEASPKLLHGEITPHYLSLPDEDIAEIKTLFPDLPIFFLARNQVDRAWSHLRKNLRRDEGNGRLSTTNPANYTDEYFMDIINDSSHEERSNYEVALRRWYNHFPDNQILIMNFDDIRTDPVGFVLQVLNHIGLDSSDANISVLKELAAEPVNTGQASLLRPSLRKKLEDHYRPYAKAFNELLEEKGYSWRLDDYPEINPNATKQNKEDG